MNRITQLLGIQYPIIQGGMIWCSGWDLASAVSNSGGLGLIGSGSMTPDILREQIRKCRAATNKPFGVNVPLIYAHTDEHIRTILEEEVPVVFTSAGNPAKYTPLLKENRRIVVHVIANSRFAAKCENAGVDAIVAEGFEAGGHNGAEETTTMCLIPAVCNATRLPVIAAGGIGSGRTMLAAFALGAEGVQVGSRFAASVESSAHVNFKSKILELKEGDTQLMLKKLIPVRIIRNPFWKKVKEAEDQGASPDELKNLLGFGRARKGMFEGDLEEGELEIGQVSAIIDDLPPAASIIRDMMDEFDKARSLLPEF